MAALGPFLAFVVSGGLVGSVIHELAHAVVLAVCGRPVRIDWRALDVRFQYDTLRLGDRVAALAPQALGLGMAIMWVATGRPFVPATPAVGAGWITLTLFGARADFRIGIRGVT